MKKIKVISVCIGLIVLVKFMDFLLSMTAYLINPTMDDLSPTLGWVLTLLVWVILSGAFIYLRRKSKFAYVTHPKKITSQQVLFIFLCGVSVNLLINASRMLLFHLVADQTMMLEMRQASLGFLDGNMLLMFLLVGIVAPITEEYLFRGIMFKLLSNHFTQKTAIIFQGVLFMLFHNNVGQFLFALILGVFLGYLTYRTNNLMVPIIFHMISNILTLFINNIFMDIGMGALGLILVIAIAGCYYSLKTMKNKWLVYI